MHLPAMSWIWYVPPDMSEAAAVRFETWERATIGIWLGVREYMVW